MSPREQIGDFVSPHLYIEALHVPWPARKRFNSDHEQRGRSKPGCREVGSSTIAQLATEADCQSSVHCEFCLQESDPTRWDAVMKVAEMGE